MEKLGRERLGLVDHVPPWRANDDHLEPVLPPRRFRRALGARVRGAGQPCEFLARPVLELGGLVGIVQDRVPRRLLLGYAAAGAQRHRSSPAEVDGEGGTGLVDDGETG